MAMDQPYANPESKSNHQSESYRRRAAVIGFYCNPLFDNLRSDPRFDSLASKIGLPQVRASYFVFS
jgi:hypothetical protein